MWLHTHMLLRLLARDTFVVASTAAAAPAGAASVAVEAGGAAADVGGAANAALAPFFSLLFALFLPFVYCKKKRYS